MTTLSDTDLETEFTQGRLVRGWDKARLVGACYELRLGNVYYDLTESDQPIQLQQNEKVLIKPGHRVVLITHEELIVPHNILVRIVSKGSLFSVGLSPVATYADPGFSGNIGIVTQNISDKYIVLPTLEPIAKADFTRLTSDVTHPYNGQHGFRTQIWPIKHQFQKEHSDVADDRRVAREKVEAYKLLPGALQRVVRGLEIRQHFVDFALVVAVVLNALALFLVATNWIDQVAGVVGNLVASVIVAVVVGFARLFDGRK